MVNESKIYDMYCFCSITQGQHGNHIQGDTQVVHLL